MKTLILLLMLAGLIRGTETGHYDLLREETEILAICEDVFPAREVVVVALSIKPYMNKFLVLPKNGKKFVCDKYIILEEE